MPPWIWPSTRRPSPRPRRRPGRGVVLRDGEVIARRHNERERTGDPTAHAEVLALRDAAEVGGWRSTGSTLVVTLEPCPMCAGALVAARVAARVRRRRPQGRRLRVALQPVRRPPAEPRGAGRGRRPGRRVRRCSLTFLRGAAGRRLRGPADRALRGAPPRGNLLVGRSSTAGPPGSADHRKPAGRAYPQ